MKSKPFIITLVTLIALLVLSEAAFAQKKAGHSFGLGGGIATASQDDINAYISSLNLAGTNQLSSAYEGYVQYGYRFGSFGLLLRPSYLSQSASGGNVSSSITGLVFMPMLRVYPLENQFLKFILQVGAGYGSLTGKISNGANSVDFEGGTFGGQAGLAVDFCFSPRHCLTVEGNLRYMPIYRNKIKATSGNMGGTIGNSVLNGELENSSGGVTNNVVSSLGGLVALVGYNLYF
ncbi:MAG: outer membrane beta-barrel protein [Bdellovibrio sp.]